MTILQMSTPTKSLKTRILRPRYPGGGSAWATAKRPPSTCGGDLQLAPVYERLVCRDNGNSRAKTSLSIGYRLFTRPYASNEGSARSCRRVLCDGNVETFARPAVWHLAAGTIRCSRGDASAFHTGLGRNPHDAFRLVVKIRILKRQVQAALRAVEPELVPHHGIVGHGAEDEAASL